MKNTLSKVILFLLIGIVLLFVFQCILVPNWTWKQAMSSDANATITGFRELEENTVDVLFVGNSHFHDGISPMQLYKNANICSYNLSVSGQTMGANYYMIKYAFETQNPKIIFLNAETLFIEEYENAWRYIVDNMHLNRLKIEMMNEYTELWSSRSHLSIILPLFEYHDRWSLLSKDDFNLINNDKLFYAAGQRPLGLVVPTLLTVNEMNLIASSMDQLNTGVIISNNGDGKIQETVITTPLRAPQILDSAIYYFDKIEKLCIEHNTKLILLKVPHLTYPQNYAYDWAKDMYERVKIFSENNDIEYIDLNYDSSLIDYLNDSIDGGNHLNVRGAEKVTAYLQNYLFDNYAIRQQDNVQYNEMLIRYKKVYDIALMQSESNFDEYLRLISKDSRRYSILVTAKNEYTLGLKDYNMSILFGENSLIDNGKYMDAYLAVIDSGNIVYEAVSDRRINYTTIISEKSNAVLCSSGWLNSPYASVYIDGSEYAANQDGLNIVVYDNETGLVIDSAYCNTRYENQNVYHVDPYSKLRAYEEAVCFNN